jgi:hypothetical protein
MSASAMHEFIFFPFWVLGMTTTSAPMMMMIMMMIVMIAE